MIYSIIVQWIGVACLLLWGFWLCCKLRLSTGFAPLLGTAFAMVVLQLFGSVGLLWPGAQLLFIGALLTLAHRHRREMLGYLLRPGVAAVLCGVAVLQIAWAMREPRFQTWDEFSHWGIFFKSVFYDHGFALRQAARSLAHPAYPQGLPALYALFALLLPKYSERDVFFTVALPLLAAGGALAELATPADDTPDKTGRGLRILHLVCACLAVPLLFRVFTPDTPYTTVYMDAPVGALFAAALLLTLLPPDARDAATLLRRGVAVGLLCAALTTVKEIGNVFALCVLGIFVLQCLFGYAARRRDGARIVRGAVLPVLTAVAPFIAVMAEWKVLLAVLHRNDDQFSAMGFGYFVQCWQEARNGVDPYFYDVWAAYFSKFRSSVLLFGMSTFKLGVLCVLLGVAVAVGLFAVRQRKAALVPLLMCLYWPCYQAALFYVYIGGMSAYEAMRVASYERYACCFFIGWLAVLTGSIFVLLRHVPSPAAVKPAVIGSAALAGALGVYGLLGFAALPDATSLPHEEWRDTELMNATAIEGIIRRNGGTNADPVWILSADENISYQNMWYYQYELSPLLVAVEAQSGQAEVQLGSVIEGHSIRYLVLFGTTEEFAQRYAGIADDNLAAAQGDMPAVYAVQGSTPADYTLKLLGTEK